MARRDTAPGGKPFEVKGGLGFTNFGGMYCLGDPSMSAPNRPQRLVNVRLGDKDIKNRPGFDATWNSGTSEAVVGMVERFKRNSGKIWYGPYASRPVALHYAIGPPPGAFPLNQRNRFAYYSALMLDQQDWPEEAREILAVSIFAEPMLIFGSFIDVYSFDPADAALVQHYVQTYEGQCPDSVLADCHRLPIAVWEVEGEVTFGAGGWPPTTWFYLTLRRPLAQTQRNFGFVATVGPPYTVGINHTAHTHSRKGEVLFVDGGNTYYGCGADEHPVCNCLDPIVLCRGKWIAPGSVYPYDNPGVIGSKSSGNTGVGTGQQFFEVTFGSQTPDTPIQDSTITATVDIIPDSCKGNFYGCDFTELFRLPGVCPSVIPPRPNTMDGKMARSMCVRTVRRDSPISASEATDEKLYIGTAGGYPLIPGALLTPGAPGVPAVYQYPVRTITNGEVYSWDGNTVKLEVSAGIGAHVVVTALPDGAVLACGRTGAKMLDPIDETWKAVTVPAYSTIPRFYDMTAIVPPYIPVAAPDARWRYMGWMWIDRVVFRGEVYLIGFDVARLAPLEELGIQYPLVPPPPNGGYRATADAFHIFRFDRATMALVSVRSGEDIYTTCRANPTFAALPCFTTAGPYDDGLGRTAWVHPGGAMLAQDGDRLYYGWSIDQESNGGVASNGEALIAAIGSYDGSTWDDDWLLGFEGNGVGASVAGYFRDMMYTPQGLWILGSCAVGTSAQAGDLLLVTGGASPNLEIVSYGPGGSHHWPTYARDHDNRLACGRMFQGPR